ncbi:MAG: hypothetical protein AVDCRST_MAG93-3541 [uncultured Chloroflexia bacterium]|uniref:Uncharacterized protein n=1 Tax=uncultured Chloroflexia bacterium TaxID=1672391 RepID=A0A6J4JS82_9CHLR|nr:MAG: hypothetical protein AVDCRST_MAG93-3541 [uncultured Chloroflexia bacterium]
MLSIKPSFLRQFGNGTRHRLFHTQKCCKTRPFICVLITALFLVFGMLLQNTSVIQGRFN